MEEEVRAPIQGKKTPLQPTKEEELLFIKCLRSHLLLKSMPCGLGAPLVKSYIDVTFRGLPATGKAAYLFQSTLLTSFIYFCGIPGCLRDVEKACPNGAFATKRANPQRQLVLHSLPKEPLFAEEPMFSESPMVAERPMLSEGPMVAERPMLSESAMVAERPVGLKKPESFNYLDAEAHVPEFRSPDDSDLNQEQEIKEQEMRAPVQIHSYDELRQRNRERQRRGMPSQRSDDSRTSSVGASSMGTGSVGGSSMGTGSLGTSSVETQPKQRVNQYGDIIFDD